MARKDATYQGSLHNIPLFNEDPDEYHRQVITTNDPAASASVGMKPKKSFFAQVAEQIDLKLLRDGAFALFAVSNFLTSLGFNVPYNFAAALAADAGVIEERQYWSIMSIGVANCFGRVVIGFLADRSFVSDRIHRRPLVTLTNNVSGQSISSLQYHIDHRWSGDDGRPVLQRVCRNTYGLCFSLRLLLRGLCGINIDYRRGFGGSG